MDLDYLKKYKQLYVIGHKNPDVDSFVSAKLMGEILCANGINAVWAVFSEDKVDEGDQRMIEDCCKEKPLVLDRTGIADSLFFLVDHNDVSQSVQDKNLVVGCVDHHADCMEIANAHFSDYCCTALFIYSEFKDSYEFSHLQKEQIYMAFLSDSNFAKGSRYKEKDEKLGATLGFSKDYEGMFLKYFIPTDLSKDLDRVFATNNIKSYKFPKGEFKGGIIEDMGTEKLPEYKRFVEEYNGNFFGLWIDYKGVKSYVYFKNKGKMASFEYDFIASRATTVVTDILKTL
ncbi:MAG: DHH family phosphoesterase [Oscillospiraceae bacterium]